MKRDINLVKEILLHIESSEFASASIDVNLSPTFPNFTGIQVTYHLELLTEAGYLKGDVLKAEGSDKLFWADVELTWAGHEFLDILKDKEVINKVMSLSKNGITSLSFDLIKDVAKKLIETKAEKFLGLKV